MSIEKLCDDIRSLQVEKDAIFEDAIKGDDGHYIYPLPYERALYIALKHQEIDEQIRQLQKQIDDECSKASLT